MHLLSCMLAGSDVSFKLTRDGLQPRRTEQSEPESDFGEHDVQIGEAVRVCLCVWWCVILLLIAR